MKRNVTMDIYKGALIVFVVIRHALQFSVTDEGGILTNIIWAIQMPGFMLVSGYFSARKLPTGEDSRERALLSAQHYALPFFSWFILIDTLLLGEFNRNILKGITYLVGHIDSGLWFLWAVFVLSILATVMNFTYSGEKAGVIKTIVAAIVQLGVLIVLGRIVSYNFLGIRFILAYSPYFLLGWLLKNTEDYWKPLPAKTMIEVMSVIVFLAIIFNYDLYRSQGGAVSRALKYAAGITGNLLLFSFCNYYKEFLTRIKLHDIGRYTLEIYATHVRVRMLMISEKRMGLYSIHGFSAFAISLFLIAVFTTMIIAFFKMSPVTDFVFYGKTKRKSGISVMDAENESVISK